MQGEPWARLALFPKSQTCKPNLYHIPFFLPLK
jgi:hypothetical protein